ncbi:hypothetical protein BGW36DRAFT_392000 [Talaromyces proteolyticus]|uniref:Uncharacterized protein n=1 Tax=Talaromyces proteolyticus TaxID=1131652 RepID=A0AAD4PUE3_9EURO|nr:uncharacterized protein BGW36DRAFT_392000 [Talaromyces proteolyticus]KAH8689208.1 hypothetical protein BGW36DRAFT_392000 [Talaromyces proteolyticus]
MCTANEDDNKYPSEIQTMCAKCHTKSLDKTPRWTKGNPTFYVIREANCDGCNQREATLRVTRAKSPFIPVNPALAYVDRKVLQSFHDRWSDYNKETRLALMGTLEPSSMHGGNRARKFQKDTARENLNYTSALAASESD